mgnify:CR=1 FL=1
MNKLQEAVKDHLRDNLPEFSPGDTVSIEVRVIEGGKERFQTFKGIVISKSGGSIEETFTVRKISGGIGANVIADKCFLEWEVRPIDKTDGDFVTKNIDDFMNNILMPKIKKNNPKGNIEKEIVGEVIGFNHESVSEAANLICNLTGDNSKDTMSFGTEAGLFQDSGISTVICGPGSIEQAHTVDEYITYDQIKKCLKMLVSLKEKMLN